MNDIETLEKQLVAAKKKDLYNKWETYLKNLHLELQKLKGQTICAWIANGRFALYQITKIEEKYYADRDGWNGDWSPKRWIEITTNGYILCDVADDRGRWYNNAKIEAYDNHRTFKFKTYSKKNNILEMSKVTFKHDSWCSGELDKLQKIGYTEYKEYSDDPNYNRALEWLTLFTTVVPNEVWDAAYEIHKVNVEQTHKFWETFSETISKAPRVYNTIKI